MIKDREDFEQHRHESVDDSVLRLFECTQKPWRGCVEGQDKRTRKFVAICAFLPVSEPTDAQRTYREMMCLHEFKGHDNIVFLREFMPTRRRPRSILSLTLRRSSAPSVPMCCRAFISSM